MSGNILQNASNKEYFAGEPRKLARYIEMHAELKCDYPRCEANIRVRAENRKEAALLLTEEKWSVIDGEVRCPKHGSPIKSL